MIPFKIEPQSAPHKTILNQYVEKLEEKDIYAYISES